MWTDEEKREQLRKGEPLHFPPWPAEGKESQEDTEARTIKAEWLAELAPKPGRVVNVPIDVANALITGPLNFQYAAFECEVSFTSCEFTTGEADFSFATFKRSARFWGSRFKKAANFRAAHAHADFNIASTTFYAASTFMDLHVDEALSPTPATFITADFQLIEVAKGAFFHHATFSGEAAFQGAHMHGDAEFGAAQFKGKATFDGIQIDSAAFFCSDKGGKSIQFEAEASFLGAHIQGAASFRGAQFKQATFDGIEIDGNAFFSSEDKAKPVQFEGEARFVAAHIHGQADFSGAQFNAGAGFDGIQIGGATFFRPARHEGKSIPVRFGGTASFSSAVFALSAEFSAVEFHGAAAFNNAHFQGATDFKEAFFGLPSGDEKLNELQKEEPNRKEASFKGAQFRRGVTFEGTTFEGPADFTAAIADRDTIFTRAVFKDAVTFREARFQVAQFRGGLIRNAPRGEELQFRKKADMRGFTYDRIYVAWDNLLKLTDYDRQPYVALEKALRSTGLEREADQVYYEQRRRGGNTIGLRRFHSWLWDRTYRYLAGYGVKVWPLVLAPILLVSLGTFVFHHYGALAEKPETTAQPKPTSAASSAASSCVKESDLFDGLSVSLRLLIRLELPSASKCVPSENVIAPWMRIKYSTYGTIHMVLGWLLVPFAVASIAARLSRRVST